MYWSLRMRHPKDTTSEGLPVEIHDRIARATVIRVLKPGAAVCRINSNRGDRASRAEELLEELVIYRPGVDIVANPADVDRSRRSPIARAGANAGARVPASARISRRLVVVAGP